MIIKTSDQFQKEKANKYFLELMKKDCTFELREIKPKRSYKQNKYLHLILGLFGLELGYTIEEAKELYKRLNKEIYQYENNGVKFYKSSASLDTKEMTLTIDRFRNWASQKGGVYLPAPNEIEYLNEVELKILNNKYL